MNKVLVLIKSVSIKGVACAALFSIAGLQLGFAQPVRIIDKQVILHDDEGGGDHYHVVGGGQLSGYGITTGDLTVGDGIGWALLNFNPGYLSPPNRENIVNGKLTINDKGQAYFTETRFRDDITITGKDSRGQFRHSTLEGQLTANAAKDIRLEFVGAKALHLTDSQVRMADSQMFTRGTALEMLGSTATVERTTIEADVGVTMGAKAGQSHSEVNLNTVGIRAATAFLVDNLGNLTTDPHRISADYYSRFVATDLLIARNGANTAFSLSDHSRGEGDVTADASSQVDITLAGNSSLTGGLRGVSSLTLDDTSQVTLTRNSDINTLSLGGGSVNFRSSSVGGFHTLTLGTLTGGGSFAMNTDVAGQRSDFLDVTGHAEGRYLLHVANTGAEPVASDEGLRLVRTGGGSADFSLKDGAVDIGAWQYTLIRKGNQWELVQSGSDIDDPYPLPEPIPDPAPEPDPYPLPKPIPDPAPEPDPYPLPRPVRSTSASTDALLNMASVARVLYYSEQGALRGRTQQANDHAAGAWGTFLHQRNDVQGAWHSAYSLRQNGMLLGIDGQRETAAGTLITGMVMSQSSGNVQHARGGTSHVEAWGGGLYASLQSQTGWYADATAKINRFDNTLSAVMTDGGAVRGRWETWGGGVSLEGGRHLSVTEHLTMTPYVALNGYQNQAKNIRLSNSMQANLGNARSMRADVGTRLSASLPAADWVFTPYADFALEQELSRSGAVRINQQWDFDNESRGTTGRLNAGLNVAVTPAASVWAEAGYRKGEHSESPIAAHLGLRIGF
ncbi:hypothetical protein CIG19_11110 [Enterobacterales bacterium CwR94]|nr:hypothetical protein CIG19_11110 [Enterobacterales bacterium CwR94]